MSTFVLRLRAPEDGEVRGVVEHVSDGRTTVVTSMAQLEAFLTQRRPADSASGQTPNTHQEDQS